jgi:hypothetical protein
MIWVISRIIGTKQVDIRRVVIQGDIQNNWDKTGGYQEGGDTG